MLIQQTLVGITTGAEVVQQPEFISPCEVRQTGGNQFTRTRRIDDLHTLQESQLLQCVVHMSRKLHEVLLIDRVYFDHSCFYLF